MNGQAGGSNPSEFPKLRKRGREEDMCQSGWIKNTRIGTSLQSSTDGLSQINSLCSSSCGVDVCARMLREKQELDIFILMQMEKLRVELEQKKRHYWRSVIYMVEEGLQRILNGKDEEIAKMNRRNTALEEKVKVLLMEGQIWRSLAQTNEATVISLRRDLELAQTEEGEGDIEEVWDSMPCFNDRKDDSRSCHGCRKNEISLLILPCRHLCLCTECDPRIELCPLCMSPKSASIKVHMQ